MKHEPFEYDRIFYNEVILYLETKWQRQLTEHECNVVIEGYRFGRLVEAEASRAYEDMRVNLAREFLYGGGHNGNEKAWR